MDDILCSCLVVHPAEDRCELLCAAPQQGPATAGTGDLEEAALKEGEYVAVRRFVRLLERGGDAKVPSSVLPISLFPYLPLLLSSDVL